MTFHPDFGGAGESIPHLLRRAAEVARTDPDPRWGAVADWLEAEARAHTAVTPADPQPIPPQASIVARALLEPEPAPVRTFQLTADHITLLRSQRDRSPSAKRPYGSSDVARDVARILNWHTDVDENQRARDDAAALHHETGTALKVVLSAGTTTPGVYHQDQAGVWRRAVGRQV